MVVESITHTAATPVQPSIVDSAVEMKPVEEELLEDKAKEFATEIEQAKKGNRRIFIFHLCSLISVR